VDNQENLNKDINDIIGVNISSTPMLDQIDGISKLVYIVDVYRKIDSKHLGRLLVDLEDTIIK